jgi:CHAD domain-containing protein
MAYRFTTAEGFAEGLSRIARTQAKRIERQLSAAEDPDLAVHQSRRGLKRLRALIAIVRPALGVEDWRSDDGRVREIARLLAGAREGKAMLDTLARLIASGAVSANGRGIGRLKAALAERHAVQRTQGSIIPPEALRLVGEAKRRAKAYAGLDVRLEMVAAGMARSYRSGRKAMQRARETGEGEAFHDWRKHVQRHWRHMLLLEEAWPEELSARARTARELARLLGEDHDLLVLAQALEGPPGEAAGARTAGLLRAAAAARQDALRRIAGPLGLRLFAERAGALEERMRHCWTAAAELRQQAFLAEPAGASYDAAVAEEHAET